MDEQWAAQVETSPADREVSRRLLTLLDELGYATTERIRLDVVCRRIEQQTGQPWPYKRLKILLEGRRVWRVDHVVQVATGLGIDVRELLYDGGKIPLVRRDKPKALPKDIVNLWPTIDEI